MNEGEATNPNSEDLPIGEPDRVTASRRGDEQVQQVVGTQIAGAAPMLNGTCGSVGPMTLDGEVRPSVAQSAVFGSSEAPEVLEAGRASAEAALSWRTWLPRYKVLFPLARQVQALFSWPKRSPGVGHARLRLLLVGRFGVAGRSGR